MKVIYLILMSSLLLTACGGGEEPPAPEQPVPEPEQPVTEPEQPVVDDTAPVITLIGANPIKLVQGAAYIELEANAEDETDGDITESIDIDESKINTQVVG
ncbi:MAG: PBP1b-binding outer membrane lipoprotein LpoB, partial [Colwellia sp.]